MVRRRQGRPAFRRALLRAYGGRCAISGCAVEPLLEAAHIHPYRGPDTNAAQNGLLLRADIHTLFDLGLITISSSMTISVSSMLASTEYAALDGSKLQLPLQVGDYPSSLALAWHRAKGSSIVSIISDSFRDQSSSA
ncbi:HNH endonuclease [Marinivivus vitaminiproducens]|uniref:HNH endonuclease n=1 Tax=Marinivivus vitaminiproducens TaxID=3035935 RepID=UPI003F9FF136